MPHGKSRGDRVGQRRRRTQRMKGYLDYVKDKTGCLICGGYQKLVFHHKQDKIDKLSQMAHSASIDTLMAEVAKCDVLCEDCHNWLHK